MFIVQNTKTLYVDCFKARVKVRYNSFLTVVAEKILSSLSGPQFSSTYPKRIIFSYSNVEV